MTPKLAIIAMGIYQVQLPDSINWSVRPLTGADADSPLVDLNNSAYKGKVSRNLGDIANLHLGASYFLNNEMFMIGSTYDYTFKGADSFSGTKNLNYNSLEENTKKQSHLASLAFQWSTVNSYMDKKFPLPMQLRLAYFKTLEAKNESDLNYVRADLNVYFK